MKNKIFTLSMDGKVKELESELKTCVEKINEPGDLNYTPLAIAVARGHVDVVQILLNNGAETDTKDQKGNTPLHYSAEYNFLEIAKLLIAKGADMSIENNFGNQALWVAVFNARANESRYDFVEFLLKLGADPNHKNNSGMSPLGFAEQIEDQTLVHILKRG